MLCMIRIKKFALQTCTSKCSFLNLFSNELQKTRGGGDLSAYKTGKTGMFGQTGKTGFMYCNKKLEITRIERRQYCVFFRCDSKN